MGPVPRNGRTTSMDSIMNTGSPGKAGFTRSTVASKAHIRLDRKRNSAISNKIHPSIVSLIPDSI